ncbi:hypothetical protein KGF54_005584 [Candida jiufengensis]|uniref:uncharacterized protein n=1 Tax=Candida jiufengensis TaxID=497108 RepID=UPI002223EF37|nr:uncharacterized protein KGF54_005584 [Candida jiufengensis]KAI5949349.1 hypothetical protein KGF54_005584 [Candida jiufengensis]
MTDQVKINPDLSILLVGAVINKSLAEYKGDYPNDKASISVDLFLKDLNDKTEEYTSKFPNNDIHFPQIDIKLLSFIINRTLYFKFVQVTQDSVVIEIGDKYETYLKNIVATSTFRYSKFLWNSAKSLHTSDKDNNEKVGEDVEVQTVEVEESKENDEQPQKVGKETIQEDIEPTTEEERKEPAKEKEEEPEPSAEIEIAEEETKESEAEESKQTAEDEDVDMKEAEPEKIEEKEESDEELESPEVEEITAKDADLAEEIKEDIEKAESDSELSEEDDEIEIEVEKEGKDEEEEDKEEDQAVEEIEKEETEPVEDNKSEETEKSPKEVSVEVNEEASTEELEEKEEPSEVTEEPVEEEEELTQEQKVVEPPKETLTPEPTKESRKRQRSRSPAPSQHHKKFQSIAVTLLNSIMEHRFSSPFLQAVNAKDAPNYYEMIYQPRDLKSISKALKSKADPPIYSSIKELERDIMLMFANCIMYNKPEEDLVDLTRKMKKDVGEMFKMFKEAEKDIK